jgi:hypothetical protein
MDLIQEISKLLVKIILLCAFGEDLSEHELDYVEGFRTTKKPVPYILREVFLRLLERWYTF